MRLILFTAICGVVNMPWALQPGHWWNDVALGASIGSVIAQIIIIRISRRTKPSSPSQQPTSSTSPSPSPSPSPSQQLSLAANRRWQSRFLAGSSFLQGHLTTATSFLGGPVQSGSLFVHSGTNTFDPRASLPAAKVEPRTVPVIGFRMWQAIEDITLGVGRSVRLSAMNTQFGLWDRGVNQAMCFAGGGHRPADPQCSCGYYVLNDLEAVPWQHTVAGAGDWLTTAVIGAVVGWGRVVQHGDEGWRAEKVQIIALLDCKISDQQLDLTRRAAEAYGVPVVGRKALELLAAEYGERLLEKQPQ